MSGIAGVYYLDGQPADRVLLQRMTAAIRHRGEDSAGYWIDGPIGLGHRMLHTTPESLSEQQPFLDGTGSLCLTFDGRVDNRTELRAALGAKGIALRTDTDAELIIQAYRCWGVECPRRVIGDFAFVIWDQKKRQLFCARDPLGIKPFFYYTNRDLFICGSEIHQLFISQTVPCEPHPGMVGEYLAVAITNAEETLYRDIYRLPPAHSLTIRDGTVRITRYWDIDFTHEIRYQTDAEYAEHFLELFQEAVQCRLRSHRPVDAYLSGGVDSSAIVCTAEALFSRGMLPHTGFETFSQIFPGLACDEQEYIEQVVQRWDIPSNIRHYAEEDGGWYGQQAARYCDFPDYPYENSSYPLLALARSKGFRVLLTGFGGDEWFVGKSWYCADLLRAGRIFDAVRWAQSSGGGLQSLKTLLVSGFFPLLPQHVQRLVRGIRGADEIPAWLTPQFTQDIQLAERIHRPTVRRPFASFAQSALYRTLLDGGGIHSLEMEERGASQYGIEQRHPFHDRRLIEFAFAIPEDQRCRSGQQKFILRRALNGSLPEGIQQRQTKAEFSHTFLTAFRAIGGASTFDALSLSSRGWIDGEQVRTMYQHMEHLSAQGNYAYMSYVWPLWMIYGIEQWLAVVFDRLGKGRHL